MIKLTEKQIQQKKDFIKNYIESTNAATGSKLDANVSQKDMATMSAEINKDINIQVNRSLVCVKLPQHEYFMDIIAKRY